MHETVNLSLVFINHFVCQTTYKVDTKRKEFREDAEFQFGSDEDAPMCLDVHPTVSVPHQTTVKIFQR